MTSSITWLWNFTEISLTFWKSREAVIGEHCTRSTFRSSTELYGLTPARKLPWKFPAAYVWDVWTIPRHFWPYRMTRGPSTTSHTAYKSQISDHVADLRKVTSVLRMSILTWRSSPPRSGSGGETTTMRGSVALFREEYIVNIWCSKNRSIYSRISHNDIKINLHLNFYYQRDRTNF